MAVTIKRTIRFSALHPILSRRKWQPTPVFLPGDFHGQRSLVGYCDNVVGDSLEFNQANRGSLRV